LTTYTLYDYLPSGNGYKVRLLLTQLDVPFNLVELDIVDGETRTPEFLQKNPDGRIPVLELQPGVFLSQSNAILIYLAEGTEFLPRERLDYARVMEWLFFEQYSHEPNIATSRFWIHTLKLAAERREQLAQKHKAGIAALGVLEQRLAQHPFLVADQYTIADIALFAYTHVAEEGHFDLNPFPAIRAWIQRVQAQPKHIPITQRQFNSGEPL
jgi:glutathione S-transferase